MSPNPERVDADAQLLGQLLSVVNFCLLVLAVVAKNEVAIGWFQLLHTDVKAVVIAVVGWLGFWLRQVERKLRLRPDFRAMLIEEIIRDGDEVWGGVALVGVCHLLGSTNDPVEGFIGQFFGSLAAAAA